jgi:hypothetical protein
MQNQQVIFASPESPHSTKKRTRPKSHGDLAAMLVSGPEEFSSLRRRKLEKEFVADLQNAKRYCVYVGGDHPLSALLPKTHKQDHS